MKFTRGEYRFPPNHAFSIHNSFSSMTIYPAIDIKGGREAGRRFIERLRLFSHLANIGDAKSLVIHPASTTHAQLDAAALAAAGIGEGMIRLSVGLEDPTDLVDDLGQALTAARIDLGLIDRDLAADLEHSSLPNLTVITSDVLKVDLIPAITDWLGAPPSPENRFRKSWSVSKTKERSS